MGIFIIVSMKGASAGKAHPSAFPMFAHHQGYLRFTTCFAVGNISQQHTVYSTLSWSVGQVLWVRTGQSQATFTAFYLEDVHKSRDTLPLGFWLWIRTLFNLQDV